MFHLANRWTLAALLATSLAASPARAAWDYVGVGDCTGNDTGSSLGAQPDPDRCSPATAGMAVVCWDEVQYRNAKAKKPVCAYKRVQAAQCTGGGNPGMLYRCTPGPTHGVTAAPPPPGQTYPAYPPPGPAVAPAGPASVPASPGFTWRYVRVGDCSGNDTGSSPSAQPTFERCDASTAGTTAVCWDGVKQKHTKFSHAACTYKRTGAGACSNGGNPGFLYECVGSAPAQPPPAAYPPAQPPPTGYTPPPAAAPGYAWRYTRIGDCHGNDVGSSQAAQPEPEHCDATTVGQTAVCWDGVQQRHTKFDHPACT